MFEPLNPTEAAGTPSGRRPWSDDLDRTSSSGGQVKGSRESTTRSARKPGRSLPRRRSSPASQAGVTVEATSACSIVSASPAPGGSVVDRPQDAGPEPGKGVELLDGRVRAVRDDRARVEASERIRAVESAVPEPLGQFAVGRRWQNWTER